MYYSLRAPRLLSLQALLLLAQGVWGVDFDWAKAIPRTGWNVTADSFQPGNEAALAIDGNASTFWHTEYSPSVAPLPHYLQVDLGSSRVVSGISYQPRPAGNRNGDIGEHVVTLSADGTTWSAPVQIGNYLSDTSTKYTFFSGAAARYVRLTARTEAQAAANQWSSVAELNLYSPDPAEDGAAFAPPPPSTQGRWDVTLALPIVAAAVAISGATDLVTFWSAYRPDLFTSGTGQTDTARWSPDPATRLSAPPLARVVAETDHDMFCPGVSLDARGDIVVTGGNDAQKTSIYDATADAWSPAALMSTPRGYQSTATLSDGRVFVIGGSWSGGRGNKNGEIYNTTTNVWSPLSGCPASAILTNDAQGVYRQDNHAWLFGWKQNSVFHAGPSNAMHWFNVSGNGSTASAGTRLDNPDSMCGNAVLYDAVAGSILTVGGSPDYQDSNATTSAHIIQIGAPGTAAAVTQVPSMGYARAFANAVVLPDGKTLVFGGQAYAVPFTDTTAALPAELYDPAARAWTAVAPIAVARTYHSVGLLLPDATVLSGGGGLCGTGCLQNHFDAQVYSPPYLFAADGSPAVRPAIVSTSAAALQPGQSLSVTTSVDVAAFSLVRYGSSTHTVNTDQRRVPLTYQAAGSQTYTITLPADPGILIPGYWMLFALNSDGVPSVSTQLKVLEL